MKLYYGEALHLMVRTLPCLMVRWGVHMLFGLGLILYYGLVFGLAWMASYLSSMLAFIIVVAGIIGSGGLYYWLRQYVFYILKAGHIAVMMEVLSTGQAPAGNQIEWGKQQVQSRFRDVSILFGVDQLLRGVIGSITNMVGGILNWLPIPQIGSLVSFAQRVVRLATDFVDEAILARAYLKREQNVWAVAQDGAILYAMAWKPILVNAVGLALISWISFVAFAAVFSLPGLLLFAILPNALKGMVAIVVVVFALLSKIALGDSFALAATMAAYYHETRELTPNPEWQSRLSQVSSQFCTLGERARETFSPQPDALIAPLPPPNHV